MTRRSPDLVILCSRRPNTVTARVFGGVLVWEGGRASLDLRRDAPGAWALRRDIPCRCGSTHGHWWVASVLRQRVGKVTTDDLDAYSRDTMSRD